MSNTTKTKRPIKGEAKVRNYLAFVEDPSTAVNQTAVARAFKAFERETDPYEKLQRRQDWLDAKVPDGSSLEADFVAVAKEWADKKGIQAETFMAQGVSRNVLRDAGFEVRTGTYKPRVKGDVVRDWVLAQKGPFTVTDAVNALSASPAGVRNVLNEEIDAKKVKVLPTEKSGHVGKPAVRYQVV